MLNGHVLLNTTDVATLREDVAKCFWDHEILELGGPLRVVHARAALGEGTAIHYHTYGQAAGLRVLPQNDAGYTNDCYVLIAPLQGVITLEGGDPVAARAHALVVNPDDKPMDLHWSSDCAVVGVSVARSVVHRAVDELAAVEIGAPLRFARKIALSESAAWWDLVCWAVRSFDSPRSLAAHPLLTNDFEQLLVTALVADQPHTYASALPEPVGRPCPCGDTVAQLLN